MQFFRTKMNLTYYSSNAHINSKINYISHNNIIKHILTYYQYFNNESFFVYIDFIELNTSKYYSDSLHS